MRKTTPPKVRVCELECVVDDLYNTLMDKDWNIEEINNQLVSWKIISLILVILLFAFVVVKV